MSTAALTEARERIQLDATALVCAWRCALADGVDGEVPAHLREYLHKLNASYRKYEQAREAFLAPQRPMGVRT